MGQIREELAATQLYKELRRGEEKSGGRCVVKELDMRRKEGGRHVTAPGNAVLDSAESIMFRKRG